MDLNEAIVIEYGVDTATRWVPYPISFARLRAVAALADFATPELVNRRESAFRGSMYCAVASSSHQTESNTGRS